MPVRAPDWYILVAVQNWNAFSNIMYDATGFAISILQGVVDSFLNFSKIYSPEDMRMLRY